MTVTSIADKIEQVIKKAHYIPPRTHKQAVIMVNAEAMFSMIDNLFTGIKILAWMVGLGTLLAGAIGVSNIMIGYRERTYNRNRHSTKPLAHAQKISKPNSF